MAGASFAHAFPPHVAVVGQRDVGEDDVFLQRRHGIEVGLLAGAGGHAEETGFGVDGVEPAVLCRLDPGDVVADGGDLPAVEALGRNQHREVGLAAGRREGRGDVGLLAFGDSRRRGSACVRPASPRRAPWSRRCAAQSTSCRAGRCRRSPSRRTRSHGSRGSADVLGGRVAGPAAVFLAVGQRCADRCTQGTNSPLVPSTSNTALPMRVMVRMLVDHVGAVGDLDADVGDRRTQRTHREGHHVHGATVHRATETAR